MQAADDKAATCPMTANALQASTMEPVHEKGLIELGWIAQDVLLPLLEVKDLAALACASKELKAMVYESSVATWHAAVR